MNDLYTMQAYVYNKPNWEFRIMLPSCVTDLNPVSHSRHVLSITNELWRHTDVIF